MRPNADDRDLKSCPRCSIGMPNCIIGGRRQLTECGPRTRFGLGVLVREYKRLEAEKAEYVHSVQQLFLADVFQHCARQNTEGNIDAMLCPGRA